MDVPQPAGPKRPRIDWGEPEKSLVLLKPTATITTGCCRKKKKKM